MQEELPRTLYLSVSSLFLVLGSLRVFRWVFLSMEVLFSLLTIRVWVSVNKPQILKVFEIHFSRLELSPGFWIKTSDDVLQLIFLVLIVLSLLSIVIVRRLIGVTIPVVAIKHLDIWQSLVYQVPVVFYFAHIVVTEVKIGELTAGCKWLYLIDCSYFVVADLQNDQSILVSANTIQRVSFNLVICDFQLNKKVNL